MKISFNFLLDLLVAAGKSSVSLSFLWRLSLFLFAFKIVSLSLMFYIWLCVQHLTICLNVEFFLFILFVIHLASSVCGLMSFISSRKYLTTHSSYIMFSLFSLFSFFFFWTLIRCFKCSFYHPCLLICFLLWVRLLLYIAFSIIYLDMPSSL